MRRVLLTGAGGFIGSALAARLSARADTTLLACSRRGEAGTAVELCDRPATTALVEAFAPDMVVHAAGRAAGGRDDLFRDNVEATRSLLDAIDRAAPQAHAVILGSAAEYGESPDRRPWKETDACAPLDDYGAAKLDAGRGAMALAADRGLNVTLLRVFNVVSEAMNGRQVLGSFVQRAASADDSGVVEMGWLGGVRDFIGMDDVVRAVEAVMDRDVGGEVINVASGRPRLVRDLVEVARQACRRAIVVNEPDRPPRRPGILWSVGDAAKCRDLLGLSAGDEVDAVVRRAVAAASI